MTLFPGTPLPGVPPIRVDDGPWGSPSDLAAELEGRGRFYRKNLSPRRADALARESRLGPNLREVLEAMRAVDFSRFPSPVRVEAWAEARVGAVVVVLVVEMLVRDRDAPRSWIDTQMIREFPHFIFDSGDRRQHAVSLVVDTVRSMLLHEMDECLLYQGVRLRDPHADEVRGRKIDMLVVDDPLKGI